MDSLLTLLEIAVTSPWLYLLVFVVVAVDSVFPVLPGETIVITAAAYAAATGSPDVVPLLLATMAGAVTGDLAAHHIGRGAGPLARRIRSVRMGQKLFDWAEHGLHTRGGMILIAARFIPGGRTATNFASGVIGYPRPRFVLWVVIAGSLWAAYNVGIGYAGGYVFQENPLIGVVIGVGLALLAGAGTERVRRLRERRAASRRHSARAQPHDVSVGSRSHDSGEGAADRRGGGRTYSITS